MNSDMSQKLKYSGSIKYHSDLEREYQGWRAWIQGENEGPTSMEVDTEN